MRTWIRLDKYLCACTGCTRSQSKLYLKKGLVKVNGEPEKRPEIKVDPGKDQVSLLETPGHVLVTVVEGKFHQIKRMFQARGNQVVYLKRTAMAGISLDPDLDRGQWRELTEEEVERLRSLC